VQDAFVLSFQFWGVLTMRYAVLVLATMLFPCFAIAAEVGQFINPANGDSVTVRLTPAGDYNALIDTKKGNDRCHFDHKTKEFNEGDLRYSTGAECTLQVLQSDKHNLSVIVIGCESFCSGTATLKISHASDRD
jgi:hypothetical protein